MLYRLCGIYADEIIGEKKFRASIKSRIKNQKAESAAYAIDVK
jgi:hypothetical protein